MRWLLMVFCVAASASCARQGRQQEIAFVGCPADGQVGPADPPRGDTKRITVDEGIAVAYYKGDNAPGAFAPAGWHCRVWYGSSGANLIVTPVSLDPPYFPAPTFQADAVEMRIHQGGTSGRYEVADKAAQFFPSAAARFIENLRLTRFPDQEYRHGNL